MLKVEKLSKTYSAGIFKKRYFKALDEVSFKIEAGETLGLVGESGCGKSTLARVLLGLIPSSSGRILFKGQELNLSRRRELREMRGKMQIIFQHPESALNPRMKIYDSLIEAMHVYKIHQNQKDERKEVLDLLEQVGLGEDHLSRYPHQLSGGQIQRVVLARILSIKPEFIVADEPTSMLDVSVQAQVLHILKDIQKTHNISYLFVSHDLEVVQWMSERIAVMHQGQIVEIAPANHLCNNPQHPYSQKLVNAFTLFQKNSQLKQADMTSHILDIKEGCNYAPYCPKASAICRQKPELRQISEGHYLACWNV